MLDKTFDHAEAEARLYPQWESSGAFEPKDDPSAEPFCIVIPPPNVTGSLHIGHALNNTLQDVLCRYHRMKGKAVLWQPGTDHAGIATQMVVERQLAEEGNMSRREMGREAFLERVWRWKAESGGTILNQLKRLGASCAWERERFTMDEGLSRAVVKVFVDLYNQDLIYRDKRLVNWDPQFQTAISDLEVENREVKGQFWHFKYPLEGEPYQHPVEFDENGEPVAWEERDYIAIATTRPETMLGDGAVAVHPSDKRYAPIVGRMVRLPLADRLIPIIADDYPDPEKGSGAVKITGAHDFNDFEVAQRHGIALFDLMDDCAHMRSDNAPDNTVPEKYRGLDRYEARKQIVADIDALGLLQQVEDRVIMQPFGDRSGVVIEPRLTDQWFVKADVLAKEAIAAVEDGRTLFVPENWSKTYFNWMHNIQPWCVSRQLWWGHRIPAWYDEEGGVHVAATEDEARKLAGGRPLQQDEDVLDTWFSAALWPFSTQGWPDETEDLKRFYPTSVLVTGFDIIFFWVARMMMQGLHFMGEVPFRDVYIHGLVLDGKGQKMSKSKGNVVDPLVLIDEYGADALRFSMAVQATQGRNVRISDDRVAGYRNFSTKLWNAARFCQMNECVHWGDFDPSSPRNTLNRWIIGETATTARRVAEDLEAYRFGDAASCAYQFVWNVFCDWYLELAKPVLGGKDEEAKAETRQTAAWVLDQILKVLHPFMPFVTEELWDKLSEFGPARQTMLIVAEWPELDADALADEAAKREIDWVIELITELRSLRNELGAPAGAKIPARLIDPSDEIAAWMEHARSEIERLARLDTLRIEAEAPAGSVQTVVGAATVALVVADVVDMKAEAARLAKEVTRLQGEIDRLDKKLTNEKFVANADPEVVAGERDKRAEYAAQQAKLRAAADQLAQASGG